MGAYRKRVKGKLARTFRGLTGVVVMAIGEKGRTGFFCLESRRHFINQDEADKGHSLQEKISP